MTTHTQQTHTRKLVRYVYTLCAVPDTIPSGSYTVSPDPSPIPTPQAVLLGQAASSSAAVEAASEKRLAESVEAVMTRLERLSVEHAARVSETQIMLEAERSRRLEVEVELQAKLSNATQASTSLPVRVKELEEALGAHRELLEATKYAVSSEMKELVYKETTARVKEAPNWG